MNMTVLFKKYTYGLLLITSVVGGFCNAQTMTSGECQTEYNLIPIENIDETYCTTNNLCPQELTGDTQRSAIYINEIQHVGAGIIDITIPEEIEREYTGDEEQLTINVIGYGYDQDKMQQLVNTQYYTPTSEDMTNLVGKIADFLPLLAVGLLFIWTWYIIKKVFRKGF